MPINGRRNVVDTLRELKLPYWKISESQNALGNGNFIIAFDPEGNEVNPDLETSMRQLETALLRLTPGTYFMSGKRVAKAEGKNVFAGSISIESSNSNAVAGIGSTAAPMFIGSTQVTPENLGEVIAGEFAKMQAQLKKEQEEKLLKEENLRLKKELAEKESGITGGLYSIGSLFWEQIKKSPAAKEMIATIAGTALRSNAVGNEHSTEPATSNAQGLTEDFETRTGSAIAGLLGDGADKPEVQNELASNLELLARLKRDQPEVYDQAIESLKLMA